MECKQCGTHTNNPSFCSRSCAATYNNKLFPKRVPESICQMCGKSITRKRTYCRLCWQKIQDQRSILKWEKCTLKEMKGVGNANAGSRYPYIRALARKKYLLSDKPKHCIICGYDKHFDVAHVKAVNSFSLDATISEINDLSNLVALCKNHHWELDHGYLKL